MRLSEGGAGDGGHSDGKDEAGWERPVRRRQTAMVVGDRAGPVRAWRAKGVDRWWGLDAGRAAREAAAEPDLERRICVRHPVAARWSRRVCRLLASRPGRSSRPIVIRSVRFRAGQGWSVFTGGGSVACVVASGAVAVAAVAGAASSAAVVAGGVEKQPAAALVAASAQTACGHRLQEVERVQREDSGEITRVACLEGPPGWGAGEAAGRDCVGERPVQ